MMVRSTQQSRPPLPPRPRSISDSGVLGASSDIIFPFVQQGRLTITTTKGVYIWDANGISEIFRSGSEGIVAAKKIEDGTNMLAVADSQVVLLHHIEGGTQKSYRLKGSQGRVRLLKYAKESKQLFFTTELQHSVQAYSLQEFKLVDTSHCHPTPPTIFAVSCNSKYLLSTSTAPPTIHLTDLSLNMLPILVRPQCSASAVVAAAFHPDRANYFVLAFADGTAAVFDAIHFFRKADKSDHGQREANVGAGGLLAFIKALHAQGTTNGQTSLNGAAYNGVDPRTGVISIGDKSRGITAVAFVPGRKAMAVTVGADGKCCVVDFTQPTQSKAVLLKSWHLRRPATSLSIIGSVQVGAVPLSDGPPDLAVPRADEAYCIAIGREDGKVLLFDLSGNLIKEHTLDEKGARIIDVEWGLDEGNGIQANTSFQPPAPLLARSPRVKLKRRSLGAIAPSQGRPTKSNALSLSPANVDVGAGKDLFDFTTPRRSPANHLGASPQATTSSSYDASHDSSRTSPTDPTGVAHTKRRRRVVTPAKTQNRIASNGKHLEDGTPPPVPPRPTPKEGGLLLMRRAQSALRKSPNDSYSSLVASARKVRTSPPNRRDTVMGPRKMRASSGKGPRIDAGRSSVQPSSEIISDDWVDVPPTPPLDSSQARSRTEYIESFQTASSGLLTPEMSDGSSDTVIEWDVGSTRRPLPSSKGIQTPLPSFGESKEPPPKSLGQTKTKKKRHESLSISSTSQDSAKSSQSNSDDSSNAIIQWPKEPSPPPTLLPPASKTPSPDKPTVAKPTKNTQRHTSIPSFASDDTITPQTSSSEDAIVQWPSLKKSTRMLGLNQAVADPLHRESATDLVLEGYLTSPTRSPPKIPHMDPVDGGERTVRGDVGGGFGGGGSGFGGEDMKALFDGWLDEVKMVVERGFEEQRRWFEGFVQAREERVGAVEKENWKLKEEVRELRERVGGAELDG